MISYVLGLRVNDGCADLAHLKIVGTDGLTNIDLDIASYRLNLPRRRLAEKSFWHHKRIFHMSPLVVYVASFFADCVIQFLCRVIVGEFSREDEKKEELLSAPYLIHQL